MSRTVARSRFGLENRSRVDANSSASTLACSLAITVPFPLCTRLLRRLDAQAPHQRMCLIRVPVAAPRATQLGPIPVVPGHLLTNHIDSGTSDVEEVDPVWAATAKRGRQGGRPLA